MLYLIYGIYIKEKLHAQSYQGSNSVAGTIIGTRDGWIFRDKPEREETL